MDNAFKATQTQEQSQILSPRMLQSLGILQMPSLELYGHLVKEIEDNPVISFDSLDIAEKIRRSKRDSTLPFENPAVPDRAIYDSSPQNSLRLQVSLLKPEPDVEHLCLQLIGMLDENGYLDREDLSIYSEIADFDRGALNESIRLLQSLEPAGVGAFSLRECILLQLERQGCKSSLCRDAIVIVRDHLELLGKNQLPQIAKKCSIPLHRVTNAKALIRTVNPRPLLPESKNDRVDYISPDIRIHRAGKGFVVELNQIAADNIVIDSTYSKIYRETDSESVRSYLDENLKKARWLQDSIRQRCETLMDCATALLNRQQAFFEYGPTSLKPYSRREMAETLGRCESTISRAFKNKYVECNWGMFPAEYFFPKQSGEETSDLTRVFAEAQIQEIIATEDVKKPLSDEQIVTSLSEMGISLSRRTIAKYRDELGIPSSSGRKNFGTLAD